jgi:hypothetical protein
MLYLIGAPAPGGWLVSVLRGPGERTLGRIHVATRRPDHVIATAGTWLREHASVLGGQVIEVKDITEYPGTGPASMAIGRVILAADVAGDFLAALSA